MTDENPMGTGGMIANLLGVAPIFEALSNPDTQAQIRAVAVAVIETAKRTARLEAKLDLLLEVLNVDPQRSAELAAVFERNGTAGLGFLAAASGVTDHGTGGSVETVGSD